MTRINRLMILKEIRRPTYPAVRPPRRWLKADSCNTDSRNWWRDYTEVAMHSWGTPGITSTERNNCGWLRVGRGSGRLCIGLLGFLLYVLMIWIREKVVTIFCLLMMQRSAEKFDQTGVYCRVEKCRKAVSGRKWKKSKCRKKVNPVLLFFIRHSF